MMHGVEGSMLKKKMPHVDMHLNSNIVISMDEKPRLKSHYMKKYNERLNKVDYNKRDPPPAGSRNFLRADVSVDQPAHLNHSRRRILNDYVGQRGDHSKETLGNRNMTQPLVNASHSPQREMHLQKQLPSYDYSGPETTVGPDARPGKFQSIYNRQAMNRDREAGYQNIVSSAHENHAAQRGTSAMEYMQQSSSPTREVGKMLTNNKSHRDLSAMNRMRNAQQMVGMQMNNNNGQQQQPKSVTRPTIFQNQNAQMHQFEQDTNSRENEYMHMSRAPSQERLDIDSNQLSRSKSNMQLVGQQRDNMSVERVPVRLVENQYGMQSPMKGLVMGSSGRNHGLRSPNGHQNLENIGSHVVSNKSITIADDSNEVQAIFGSPTIKSKMPTKDGTPNGGHLYNTINMRNSIEAMNGRVAGVSFARPNQVSTKDLQNYQHQFRSPQQAQRLLQQNRDKIQVQRAPGTFDNRRQSQGGDHMTYAEMERELAAPYAQGRVSASPYSLEGHTPLKGRSREGLMNTLNSKSQVNIMQAPVSMPQFNTIEATQNLKKVFI